MNTAGLVIDPHMLCGFKFEVVDTIENKANTLSALKKCTSF
jgi:fructose 1,6-bisphosphatase